MKKEIKASKSKGYFKAGRALRRAQPFQTGGEKNL